MIAWAVETLAATAMLALLVLALRRPVAAHCGAGWAYALWLIVPLRLVMPPLELFGIGLADALPLLPVGGGAGEATASLPPIGGPGQWVPILLALWAGGAAVSFLWLCVRHLAFVRRVEAETRPSFPAEYGGLPVVESRGVEGPLAIGLFQPRIVVPFDFLARYGSVEQQLALHHEWVHHCRGDLWWNLLALGLLAAHWFNPVAWIAFRAFRADQELACDAAVIRETDPNFRHAYALALIKSASRPGPIAACPLNSADQLKRRLQMMNKHRSSRMREIAGGLVCVATLAAGLGLSAPVLAQGSVAESRMERRIFVREIGKDGKRELPAEIRELTSRCPEARRLESDIQSGSGGDKQRTRVIVCNKDGTAPTAQTRDQLIAALDRARTDLEGSTDLKPERRAQVVEALRREIERVRSGGK